MMDLPPIRDLVPHDTPMVLLDELLSLDTEWLSAGVTIRPDSPFAHGQGVPAWVGLEYMGQAIAAWAGARARQRNEPVRIGFLVSTRRYEPGCSYFPIGTRLEVGVQPVTDDDVGLQVFQCTLTAPGIRASAALNVYMPEDVDAFLQESGS